MIEFNNTSDLDGPGSYIWDFGNGNISSQENPINTFDKGLYEVTLIAASAYGCSDTISKTYNLVGPEGDFTLDQDSICSNEIVNFELIDTVDVDYFKWFYGDGTTDENVNPVSHAYDFIPPNGYVKVDLLLVTEGTGCETVVTDSFFIQQVEADYNVELSEYCGGLAQFVNQSVGPISNYLWDFGDGNTSTEQNPSNLYDPGIYNVNLIVSNDSETCTDTLNQSVDVADQDDFLKMPNVFSPNNDGVNDYFNIAIDEDDKEFINVITFKVYNRWGNLVYDNEDPDNGWDGNFESNLAPAEVYAYFIEVELIDCEVKSEKGNVTLVR